MEQERITPIDLALASIARANAWALDAAEAMGKKGVYAVSNLTTPYREALTALKMVPTLESDSKINEQLASALETLGKPGSSEVGNAPASSS